MSSFQINQEMGEVAKIERDFLKETEKKLGEDYEDLPSSVQWTERRAFQDKHPCIYTEQAMSDWWQEFGEALFSRIVDEVAAVCDSMDRWR